LDDGRDHYHDGVEGETGKVDEGSATILATSRKEGDVKGDTVMKPEVETIAMFEGVEDAVVTMDKGSGTRSTMTRTRAETRLRTRTRTTKTIARLRARNEHDREWGKLTRRELVIESTDMTGLYTSVENLRR
jgi:hypothetical protein